MRLKTCRNGNHYIVKEMDRTSVIHKKYDDLDEAIKHCLIYTRASEGKPIAWWVLTTERLIPDGYVLGNAD